MKIVFAGIIARYPFGGVTWCSLMLLPGLRALGHELLHIEDTGECIYDPEQNTRSLDPSYGTRYPQRPRTIRSRQLLELRELRREPSRPPRRGRPAYCAEADLFINLSGGSWFWRDEYAHSTARVIIDSDPVFTQLAIAKGSARHVDSFRGFDHLFTFGPTSGRPLPTSRTAVLHGTRRGSRWSPICGA